MNNGTSPLTDQPPEPDAPLSKTRRKQQMHALQALGERLVKLPEQQLARVPMPDDLAQAVHEARRTRSHEGLRRQLQYVGKLMRSVDAQAIAQALIVDEERHQGAIHLMHRAEYWRDGLLDGSLSLTTFIDEHPAAAQLGLPALLAQARREKAAAKPPRQQRQLYRLLHSTMVEAWRTSASSVEGSAPLA
ncbi:MAG: ribosome biogenesis factor YjgA [Lautropia sp.]|nr:ribosome biogenesis factor YjgA [Lautropia sp.]